MTKAVTGERGCYKLDHPYFREVYETTYEIGIIRDIQVGENSLNSLLDLPNTCTVEVAGSSFILPVFYNCKKDCYTEKTGRKVSDLGIAKIPDEEALYDGVKAFAVGEGVKVLCEEEVPLYVIGSADHTPRRCMDVIRMHIYSWGTTDAPELGGDYYMYFVGGTASEYGGPSKMDSYTDPYGIPLKDKCTRLGYILFGKRTFQRSVTVHYWGDFFVRVGPLMYIIRVRAIHYPPLTGTIIVFGAVWSEDLEATCKRLGAQAEETIIGHMWGPWPVQPSYPAEVQLQSVFTQTFCDRFSGAWTKFPAPVWLRTKFYGEE